MKNRAVAIIVFFVLLSLVAFYFDEVIVKAASLMRNNFLDNFFMGLTYLSSEIIIFFILTSLFLWQERKRKWILPLWFTFFVSAFVSFLLKFIMQRQRPFQIGIVQTLDILRENSHLIWNFSFPSFQAMLAFCAIPILSKEFPKFKYAWTVFAVLVAFSRVYFGVHFLSDVIAGGLMGYLIGITVVKHEKETKFWEKIYEKIKDRLR